MFKIVKYANSKIKRGSALSSVLANIISAGLSLIVLFIANKFLGQFGLLTKGAAPELVAGANADLRIYLIAMLLSVLCDVIASYCADIYSGRMMLSTKASVYSHMIRVKYREISKYDKAELNKRIDDDSTGVSGFTSSFVKTLSGALPKLVMTTVFCIINFPFLIAVAVGMGAVLLAIIGLLQLIMTKLEKKYKELDTKRFGAFARTINCFVYIRTNGLEEFERQKQADYAHKLLRFKKTLGLIGAVANGIMSSAGNLLMLVVFIFSIKAVLAGNLAASQLIAMMYAFIQLFVPIVEIISLGISYAQGKVSHERLLELENLPVDDYGSESVGSIERIECKGVKFCYDPGITILDGFSQRFEKGRIYFLKGPNGSGKTTVLRLLGRLYDDYEGEIVINGGKELRELSLASLYSHLTYVEQEDNLGGEDIVKNIFYGNEGLQSADIPPTLKVMYDNLIELYEKRKREEEEQDASKKKKEGPRIRIQIGLSRDTDGKKPQEEQSGLSGGERKKVSLIRGLLNARDVILLDEPTNNLDIASIEIFFKHIKAIKKDHTIIMVIHGDEYDEHADEIVNFTVEAL